MTKLVAFLMGIYGTLHICYGMRYAAIRVVGLSIFGVGEKMK